MGKFKSRLTLLLALHLSFILSFAQTKEDVAKIIKNYEELVTAGYGQGHGRDYKPCKTVQNFSSIGRSHRVQGRVSKRLHHLFSDLELSTFLLLDWNQNVTDIREHYPLDIQLKGIKFR